jgi:hypothetical protein
MHLKGLSSSSLHGRCPRRACVLQTGTVTKIGAGTGVHMGRAHGACAWPQARPPLGQLSSPCAARVRIMRAAHAQPDTHQRVSDALVAACMKRTGAWIEGGGGNAAAMPGVRVKTAVHGIKGHGDDRPWTIAVTGVAVRPGPGTAETDASAVVCLAVHCPGIGGSAPSAGLFDLLLHWGVSDGHGGQWAQWPPEWHTSPPVSYDAGGGAWQTPFNKASARARARARAHRHTQTRAHRHEAHTHTHAHRRARLTTRSTWCCCSCR